MPTVPPMLSANNDYPGLSAVNAVIITSRVVHFLSTGGCFSPAGIYGRFPATAGLPLQSISDARRSPASDIDQMLCRRKGLADHGRWESTRGGGQRSRVLTKIVDT